MSTTRRFPQVVVTALAVTLLVAPARAAATEGDNMLRGPHPFRRGNELSAHVLIAAGGDNTPNGGKLGLDYGYKLRGPVWLNLQLNSQRAGCTMQAGTTRCSEPAGQVYETIVGAKLKWATAIPLVPFVKGGVGLAYAFPVGASNGLGLVARAGGGVNYFFFDWLGLGLEINFSLGSLTTASSSYSVMDFGGGVEFQF
jgi:hypothetical protein